MTTVRIKFCKGEEIKYISHLDVQRCFHRLFRRAKLNMMYSQGFNPHPKMSVAMAMPVGMTSQGEYLDMEVPESIDTDKLKESLNNLAPRGLTISQVKVIEGSLKSLSATITTGIFRIKIYKDQNCHQKELGEMVQNVLNQEKIELSKKNKKGKIVQKDIRPLIKYMKIVEIEEDYVLIQLSSCIGSKENLNPQMLIDFLISQYSYLKSFPKAKVHRVEMFVDEDITPMDLE